MNLAKKNIVVDVERMKYPNTGLHNFCLNLMQYLSKDSKYNYYFYLPKNIELDNLQTRLDTKILHKLYLKTSQKFSLWHATYQTTKYVPAKPIKFILTIHDLNFLYEDKPAQKKNKLLKKIQKLIDRADYITTISNFVLEEVKTHLNLNNKKVKVIYNGVSLVRNNSNVPNLTKDKFYFTIGTVLPKKNIQVLFKLLTEENSPQLIIAGILPDEAYLTEIKNIASNLKVKHKISFVGAITEFEKFWYYKNCEAFFFPSLAEGFGLPVIEAMLLGKPVFLSTKTCLPEIGGKHAYYFENFELEHMKRIVEKGMHDYHINQKSDVIKNWANQFSWENAIQEYINVYQEVLKAN